MIYPGKNKQKNTQEELEKLGQFSFQIAIHFHPIHPQPRINDSSFCVLVGLLLTKVRHYLNVSVDTKIFFRYSK